MTIHQPEKVIFMNMCMIRCGNQVLALNKVNSSYTGITFPGGHVEPHEMFYDAVIREIYEETGLTIKKPKLKGIYHWYVGDLHNIGYLYRADEFEGELKSSSEGQVYWIDIEDYKKLELAVGMHQVLEIMLGDTFQECYMEVKEDGLIQEHLF